jgi:metallo-beta-lactamase family protein
MRITCIGGVRTVTGTCFLCRHGRISFLVDCGMFQGGRDAEKRNRARFPFDPAGISAVLLTHAHIDHSGLLPRLVKEGFRGKIYATAATVDLCGIMLPDSGHIQQMEAEWQTRKNQRLGQRPVEPLYTVEDAQRTEPFFEPVRYEEPFQPFEGLTCCFRDAGHILGSAFLEIAFQSGQGEKRILFSGDLGHPGQFIVRDPSPPGRADFVFIESTYGNRCHRPMDETLEELAQILQEAARTGGKVIIPAFAVERTQELLHALHKLQAEGRAPALPTWVDSPLAISATDIFRKHPECFDEETLALLATGENPLETASLRFARTAEESQALNEMEGPLIVISASGMCDAGRIKHHLKHNLWKPGNHVVIIGYQAKGTLGRELVDGAQKVRIFREDVSVKAKIHTLGGFSAHADQPGLLDWIGRIPNGPSRLFVVHGEEPISMEFASKLKERFASAVEVPSPLEEIRLAEPAYPERAAPLPERDRALQESARQLLNRLQALSDRIAEKDWESDPVQRHHVEKQLRKLRRYAEKLERAVSGGASG